MYHSVTILQGFLDPAHRYPLYTRLYVEVDSHWFYLALGKFVLDYSRKVKNVF